MEAVLEYQNDAILGEGPVWDESKGVLYWVDILSGRLFAYHPDTQTNIAHEMGEHLGAVALRKKGGLVLALQSGFVFYDLDSQQITDRMAPASHPTTHRFNDGKCDPSGRFWAGALSYDLQEGAGRLYCLNHDLSVDLKLQHLTLPNGMAWSADRTKFYIIDTLEHTVWQFGYEDATGKLTNRTAVRTFEESEGLPDGMTIDREGALWIALYNGFKVIRIDPGSGKTLSQIRLPVPQVTSCTFGGPQLDELYITTARENMPEEQIRQYPLSGSLFKARLPVKGRPATRFAG